MAAVVLGLYMGGLAFVTQAQTAGAADVRAALERARAANEAARVALEDAKAAANTPPANWDHLPPDKMPLEPYVDAILISVESGWIMQVARTPLGRPVVRLHGLDGSLAGRFMIGNAYPGGTADATAHEVLETGFANCPGESQPGTATLQRDGSGITFMWHCGAHFYSYYLTANGPGIQAKVVVHAKGTSQLDIAEHDYLPMTDELGFAAATKANERREAELRRAEEARLRQEREMAAREARSAERWSMFGAVANGVLDAGIDVARERESESRRELDATLAGINARIAAQQRTGQPHSAPTSAPAQHTGLGAEPQIAAAFTGPAAAVGVRPPEPSPVRSAQPDADRECRTENRTFTKESIPLSSRALAENHVRGGLAGACPLRSTPSVGPLDCTEDDEPVWGKDDRGVPKVVGRRPTFTCSATVTCSPVEVCSSTPGGGASAQ